VRSYRKIDHVNVVTADLSAELSNAGHFSHSSMNARIDAGYHDPIARGIGRIEASMLVFGVTSQRKEHAWANSSRPYDVVAS
jgi:hypothetical protein